MLLVGGAHDLQPGPASDAEISDPATGTFRVTGNLTRPRISPIAVAVDDRVLVLGNLDIFGGDLDTSASTEWYQ